MFGALDISASGLAANRTWLDVVAGNIANMQARGANGEPYRRRVAEFGVGDPATGGAGVHVRKISKDPRPFRMKYDPSDPLAQTTGPQRGYVLQPQVDASTEMVDAMTAARAYEANVTVMEISKTLAASTLRLLA